MTIAGWLVAAMSLVVSWWVCGAVRRHAIEHAILDEPNARSSHSVPTPRGGGAAIVVALVASAFALTAFGEIPVRTCVALLGVVPIAAIGWMDDRRSVGARTRALVHAACGVWAIAWLGGFATLTVGERALHLGLAGSALALVGIVWNTNLFNFMDGIDGIAGAQATSVALMGYVLLELSGASGLAALALATAAAALGFLRWNWSPAKIFMGDVGSGALGYWFAVLAIASDRASAVPVLLWGLLGGAFIVDATITLVRRAARGETWYSAHRSHAYQRLTQSRLGHAGVAGAFVVVNIVLAVLALRAYRSPSAGPAYVAAGFALLGVLYWLVERRFPFRTGARAQNSD